MPEENKKFNFGTGEIDKNKWLQDIDAGLPEYYNTYGSYWGNERTEEVRKAMSDLIGRISSGDMQSRTANGTYNFGSNLYDSSKMGKYTRWAYRTALGYLGNTGKRQVTSAKPETTDTTKRKVKYSPQTLLERLNNTIQRGAVELNLSDTWWATATKDERANHLKDFFKKEADYIRNSQDFDDVETAYSDLGRQGLADMMANLSNTLNGTGNFKKNFNQLGITSDLINEDYSEKPAQETQPELTTDQQIQQYIDREADDQKKIRLGWYQSKGPDAYFQYDSEGDLDYMISVFSDYPFQVQRYTDTQNFIKNNKDEGLGGAAALGAIITTPDVSNPDKSQEILDSLQQESAKFRQDLANNWEALFRQPFKGLPKSHDGSGELLYTPEQFTENLAIILAKAKDLQGVEDYIYYGNDEERPIQVNDSLIYIPGTYRRNGSILLYDTKKKKLVKSSILNYPALEQKLGNNILYNKQGGILKFQNAGKFNRSRWIGTPKNSQETTNLTSEQRVPQTKFEEPKINEADYAILASIAGDIASTIMVSRKNPMTRKIGAYTNVASGLLGAYGETEKGIAGTGTMLDVATRIGAASPFGSFMQGYNKRKTWQRLGQFFYQNSAAIAYALQEGFKDNELPGAKRAWRKIQNGQFADINMEDAEVLGRTLSVLLATRTSNTMRATRNLEKASLSPESQVRNANTKKTVFKKNTDIEAARKNGEAVIDNVTFESEQVPESWKAPWRKKDKIISYPYISDKSLRTGYKYYPQQHWWEGGRVTNTTYDRVRGSIPENKNGYFPWGQFESPRNVPREKPKRQRTRIERPPEESESIILEKLGGKLNALKYLRGGIIKAQAGTSFKHINAELNDDDYLKAWTKTNYGNDVTMDTEFQNYRNTRHNRRGEILATAGTYGHNNTQNLQSAYDEQQNYYNTGKIFDDVLTNYNIWKGSNSTGNINDFITYYNQNVDTLRERNKDKLNAQAQTGGWKDFNELFRKMYPSYTTGFDNKLIDIIGESTWRRIPNTFNGPEKYKDKRTGLLIPEDETSRVYMDDDGHLYTEDSTTTENPIDQETEQQQKPIPQPELKEPFDIIPLAIGARALATNLGNEWLFGRMLDRQPAPLYRDFIDRKLDTIGDHAKIGNAYNQAADLRRIQQLRQVSDQTLNLAADAEMGRIGRETVNAALLEDASRQAETHENALKMDLRDVEDNRDTAFINRQSLYSYLQDRFDIKNARDKARVDVTTGLVNNLTGWWVDKYRQKKAIYDQALQYINKTPEELYQEYARQDPLYHKALNGTLTDEERQQWYEKQTEYRRRARQAYATSLYSTYGGNITTPTMSPDEGAEKGFNAKAKYLSRLRTQNPRLTPSLLDNWNEELEKLGLSKITNSDLEKAGYKRGNDNIWVASSKNGGTLELIKKLRQ